MLMSVPWTPSTSTVCEELALRGSGITRVDDQSTVWQNDCAASALIPAISSPASATCWMFKLGGTLTVGLGTSARNTQLDGWLPLAVAPEPPDAAASGEEHWP